MLKPDIYTPLVLALAVVASGCGVDQETLGTPTRYMDPSIPCEELSLFHDADFETERGGTSAHWAPRTGHEQQVSVTASEVYSGKFALSIAPGPEWYFVKQSVRVDPAVVAGRVLTATVMVKAESSPNVTVNLALGDVYQYISPRHPSDGNWHKMKVSCLVPEWWTNSEITLTLTTGGAPLKPVYFDDVRLYVK